VQWTPQETANISAGHKAIMGSADLRDHKVR
jgi:hypothetical protein